MNETEFGDTPMSRCRYYRQVCDLPAIIVPSPLGRIIIRAGMGCLGVLSAEL
ncbi:hypothetical protein AB0B25_15390 [Nocardia sp. NPDC049190]|uniref:hypothetical protein n=1 Tax=Nocardia sp. NPDC049190 TaxID=3155650 RepID=UPI0033F5197F